MRLGSGVVASTVQNTSRPSPIGSPDPLVACGFFALFVLTYFPLLQTGLSDHDSAFVAIRFWTEENYLSWLSKLVGAQGRWHYYYGGFLWVIPFLKHEFCVLQIGDDWRIAAECGCFLFRSFSYHAVGFIWPVRIDRVPDIVAVWWESFSSNRLLCL
jgi:hypothetical protein